jgi:DNA polymerase-4
MGAVYRKIIHIDMDAFFASVEQRDNPELRGKPVAVGGTSRRGVVAAASYEARAYGVRSAMPTVVARRRCPQLILVKSRFDVYRAVSHQIREIFYTYTDLVEPLSIDEAFLDVTHVKQGPPSATLIAREIKARILKETGLTASAGVSINKFLAKLASDVNKPDGLTVILPEEAEAFVAALPVDRFYGVGPVTAERMRAMGIETGADLRARSEEELRKHFGKAGSHFYRIARALDDRPVRPDRQRKSVGAERTFEEDLIKEADLLKRLEYISAEVARRLERSGTTGRTVTLKIKYFDFVQQTRSRTLPHEVRSPEELFRISRILLNEPSLPTRPVRLLGLSVSGLTSPTENGGSHQLVLDL